MTSLTAVLNYLFAENLGIKTSAELASALGIEPHGEFGYGPGNETVLKWFRDICRHFGVAGYRRINLRDKEVKNWNNNAKLFASLKDAVKSDNQVLVYHMDKHYTSSWAISNTL
ncbi:MAG TPA: hypothetical protein PLF99_09955 [Tenuifilaceae bacterium]|nr:hypothetical protein [Tenuifilaceae bacterium]